ncbi:hypothetical protein DL93DRAFT_2042821, partial [Clavulina sp. PMI_390]
DEEDDKREEIRADAERPFPVDRALLKETIRQHMHSPVVRMQFLSSGTFHKAFLAALEDGRQVVARIARRFMPRLKTESEVATINYLRLHTPIPVPIIYHWDSNPYNRLGHEYIIMSKAPGIPLRAVWNRMRDEEQHALLRNLARLVVDLSTHRFSHVGSLYQKPREKVAPVSSSATAGQFFIGPIVSWPFFGDGRGELESSTEIDRGPWPTEEAYLAACARREIDAVKREGAGKERGHRPHLPPRDRLTRHGSSGVGGVDDDELSTSSSSSSSSSEDDETFYRDYRANLRSSLLVAQHATRLRAVEEDMKRFRSVMERELKGVERELAAVLSGTGLGGDGSFVLHAHDLSLANIFVDEDDPSRITCIIDWESSAIRPLWHAAHLPSFLLPPPPHAHNTAAHASSSHGPPPSTPSSNNTLPGKLWLAAERAGDTARDLHRFVEWDGWEEGLLETVVGHD